MVFFLDVVQGAQKGVFADDEPLKCYMKCLMDEMATVRICVLGVKKLNFDRCFGDFSATTMVT